MAAKALEILKETRDLEEKIKSQTRELNNLAPTGAKFEDLSKEFGVSQSELKNSGVLKVVLGYLVNNMHDDALRAIEEYISSLDDYPGFRERVERYREYSAEVIRAIQVKREVTLIPNISNSKQHELREKIKAHIRELNKTLITMEKVERELKLEDLRSTVTLVKMTMLCVTAVFAVLIVQELNSGVLRAVADLYWDMVEFVSKKISQI